MGWPVRVSGREDAFILVQVFGADGRFVKDEIMRDVMNLEFIKQKDPFMRLKMDVNRFGPAVIFFFFLSSLFDKQREQCLFLWMPIKRRLP